MRIQDLDGTHLSDQHIPRADQAALIARLNQDQAQGILRTATLTIAIGQSTGTATVPAGSIPLGAQVQQATADGTLLRIERININGTTLTVYGNANATAAVTVRYSFFAPVT